ncbi:HNH endonuclease signature motif containing protein [Leucobacter salsicius]|uniref:HNH endonuclease signature motif containing protein n=1 Tax=Leucobacter salsicius TaxID=664638 RepID=UPI00034C2315|nr:HNH endonuclease signature motif containing protein [Leucobacter salsicius]
MELFTSLTQQLAAVRQLVGEVTEASAIPEMVRRLPDDEVLAVLEAAATVMRSVERFQLAASGVVAERSTRSSGHSGLAQSRGHRNPASLVQQITGATRAESAREVRVGESLLAAAGPEGDSGDGGAAGGAHGEAGGESAGTPANGLAAPAPVPWHAPLRTALLDGTLSSPQHDAIQQGLGEPPVPTDASISLAERQCHAEATREAWQLAAEELVREAQHRTVEELRQAARSVRDMLDPVGAEQRAQARYEARSFRLWRDAEGAYRGSFTFDDEAGAWVRHLIDAALRPRRGGPRFVDPDEKARAQELIDDPRTNDQLTHDLLIDVLRGGTLADPAQVMGARQAGVRVVTVVDTLVDTVIDAEAGAQGVGAVTFLEEDGIVVGARAAQRQTCDSGIVPISVDRRGNPLNVGREQRLFTSKQRIALSIRDGGCRWRDCDRTASYCEAHHIDEWAADQGRTDIDRGLLLCRFHHMQLHNGGWRITRDGTGPFLLHDQHGATFTLPPRTSRTTAWSTALNFSGLEVPAARFFPERRPRPAAQVPSKMEARPVSAPMALNDSPPPPPIGPPPGLPPDSNFSNFPGAPPGAPPG